MIAIRPFTDADYARYVEIHNRAWPDELTSERDIRYFNDTWDESRYFKQRLVAVNDAGDAVGFGRVCHLPEQFHPDKYQLGVLVDPDWRRQGYGGALYRALLDLLLERQGIMARSWVRESAPASIRFATNRNFTEVRREWQSRLDVNAFDPTAFASAWPRIAANGITITTLAEETAANPNLWHEMYDLDIVCTRDIPMSEPFTPMVYDDFVKTYVTAPYVLAEGFFIARHGDRPVGVARLWSSKEEPDILTQDLTGVVPEYRGQGIAMALKLKTVEFARAQGKREIRTWNDTMNRAMLRINEAMGFVKQPAEIEFACDLTASGTAAPDVRPSTGATS
jgi:mycothiol synthase